MFKIISVVEPEEDELAAIFGDLQLGEEDEQAMKWEPQLEAKRPSTSIRFDRFETIETEEEGAKEQKSMILKIFFNLTIEEQIRAIKEFFQNHYPHLSAEEKADFIFEITEIITDEKYLKNITQEILGEVLALFSNLTGRAIQSAREDGQETAPVFTKYFEILMRQSVKINLSFVEVQEKQPESKRGERRKRPKTKENDMNKTNTPPTSPYKKGKARKRRAASSGDGSKPQRIFL